jgi:hypothetical protein
VYAANTLRRNVDAKVEPKPKPKKPDTGAGARSVPHRRKTNFSDVLKASVLGVSPGDVRRHRERSRDWN